MPSRSISVTNKSNSLTYTVASSFVSSSTLAATFGVGFFDILTVFQLGRVTVFSADHVHTCSGIYHKLYLSSGFIVDVAGKIHSSAGE